jgi:hypothetical protein
LHGQRKPEFLIVVHIIYYVIWDVIWDVVRVLFVDKRFVTSVTVYDLLLFHLHNTKRCVPR